MAAVDCGTNSTRLLVVDADGTTLERRMKVTGLGQGVDATGHLREDAIRRTADVLAEYRDVLGSFGVGGVRASATSAVRDADNADQFFAAAQAALGTRPELLSGEEEGKTAFLGATSDLSDDRDVVVADVGGGSTELVRGRPGREPEELVSLPMGCVRLTERYLHHDPPTPEELRDARDEADSLLEGARRILPRGGDFLLVGLAGTVSTLASLELALETYDPSLIHHFSLSAAAVAKWEKLLGSEGPTERLDHAGMPSERVPTIVGGTTVVNALMRWSEADVLLVSESDILDGLAATLLREAQGTGSG